MSEASLADMRVRLETERAALRDNLTDNSAASAPVELDQTRQGRLSRMDAMQQQAMAQANAANSRVRLAAIEAAIRRIDDGSYGECMECGEPVSVPRLNARPEARLCIACKSAAENR